MITLLTVTKWDNILGYSHLNLESATHDRQNHAHRLGDQAAAHVAIQRQPEGTILWGKQRD